MSRHCLLICIVIGTRMEYKQSSWICRRRCCGYLSVFTTDHYNRWRTPLLSAFNLVICIVVSSSNKSIIVPTTRYLSHRRRCTNHRRRRSSHILVWTIKIKSPWSSTASLFFFIKAGPSFVKFIHPSSLATDARSIWCYESLRSIASKGYNYHQHWKHKY